MTDKTRYIDPENFPGYKSVHDQNVSPELVGVPAEHSTSFSSSAKRRQQQSAIGDCLQVEDADASNTKKGRAPPPPRQALACTRCRERKVKVCTCSFLHSVPINTE
jgi:hypothetical protein